MAANENHAISGAFGHYTLIHGNSKDCLRWETMAGAARRPSRSCPPAAARTGAGRVLMRKMGWAAWRGLATRGSSASLAVSSVRNFRPGLRRPSRAQRARPAPIEGRARQSFEIDAAGVSGRCIKVNNMSYLRFSRPCPWGGWMAARNFNANKLIVRNQTTRDCAAVAAKTGHS